MSNEILNSLLKDYEQKKLQAELDSEKRKEELYEKNSTFKSCRICCLQNHFLQPIRQRHRCILKSNLDYVVSISIAIRIFNLPDEIFHYSFPILARINLNPSDIHQILRFHFCHIDVSHLFYLQREHFPSDYLVYISYIFCTACLICNRYLPFSKD